MKNEFLPRFFLSALFFTVLIVFTSPEINLYRKGYSFPVSEIFYIIIVSVIMGFVYLYISDRYVTHHFERVKKLMGKYFSVNTEIRTHRSQSLRKFELSLKDIDRSFKEIQNQIHNLNLDRELFFSLLNGLDHGVFCVNRNYEILFQNSSAPDELIMPNSAGKPFFAVIRNAKILEKVSGILDRIDHLHTGAPELQEFEFQISSKFFRVIPHPISTSKNEKIEIILFIILDETKIRMEEKIREEFFMNAGHELKTPITSIQGYTETIHDRCNNDTEKRFLEAILRNIYRMNKLVEDMTSVSSITSKFYPFHPVNLNLESFLNSLQDLTEGILKRKNQKLNLQYGPEIPELMADPLLLEHLMSNLIRNASQYSPENTVIQITARRENEKFIQIEVRDQGPGIHPDHREKIFERFFRSDKNRTREDGGTGLGLSIAKQIVSMHGGIIAADNADGGGAVIRFTLKIS